MARLVWLVMEISDNSREMEKYDQPESHALCHHKPVSELWFGFVYSLPTCCFLSVL